MRAAAAALGACVIALLLGAAAAADGDAAAPSEVPGPAPIEHFDPHSTDELLELSPEQAEYARSLEHNFEELLASAAGAVEHSDPVPPGEEAVSDASGGAPPTAEDYVAAAATQEQLSPPGEVGPAPPAAEEGTLQQRAAEEVVAGQAETLAPSPSDAPPELPKGDSLREVAPSNDAPPALPAGDSANEALPSPPASESSSDAQPVLPADDSANEALPSPPASESSSDAQPVLPADDSVNEAPPATLVGESSSDAQPVLPADDSVNEAPPATLVSESSSDAPPVPPAGDSTNEALPAPPAGESSSEVASAADAPPAQPEADALESAAGSSTAHVTVDVPPGQFDPHVTFAFDAERRAREEEQAESERLRDGFYDAADAVAPDGSTGLSTESGMVDDGIPLEDAAVSEVVEEAASREVDAAAQRTSKEAAVRRDTLVPPPQDYVTGRDSELPSAGEVIGGDAETVETSSVTASAMGEQQEVHDAAKEAVSLDGARAQHSDSVGAAGDDGQHESAATMDGVHATAFSGSDHESPQQQQQQQQQQQEPLSREQGTPAEIASQQPLQQQAPAAHTHEMEVVGSEPAPAHVSEDSPADELGALAAHGHNLLASAWEQRHADKARRQMDRGSEYHQPRASPAFLCRTCGAHVARADAHLHDVSLSGARILGRRQEPELGASL
jgi:hypothetical protein